MASRFRPEHIVTAPFVRSSTETLDPLDPLVQPPLTPDQLTTRARTLLAERCGVSGQHTEAAFAHAAPGLLSGHTHYFDGFALLMAFHQGTAVAVRETAAEASVLVFDGSPARWTFDATAAAEREAEEWPAWAGIVKEVVQQVGEAEGQVEVAVVSTIPASCTEAYLAALGVAAARAVQALRAVSQSTTALLETLCRLISERVGLPFSSAYLIATEAGRPSSLTLVDTATGEQLPLDAPPRDGMAWGLVDVGGGRLAKATMHWERKDKAEKALAVLQKRGFDQLTSFRDLEHRDLKRALEVLPRRLRPIVRHLVSENRRVQRMVFATNQKDWQMFGALLLMSHASLRDDWEQTTDEVDFVVAEVEALSLDGMYGASVTGRGGCVLVVGKPFVVPACLNRIKTGFETRFGRPPDVMLL